MRTTTADIRIIIKKALSPFALPIYYSSFGFRFRQS